MSGPHPDPLSDMLSKPHELDGRFEREAKTVTTCISDAALTSIAVSLKRIADAMDGGVARTSILYGSVHLANVIFAILSIVYVIYVWSN